MQAATASVGFAPTLDVLPDLGRTRAGRHELVLPLVLLAEFLSGLLLSFAT